MNIYFDNFKCKVFRDQNLFIYFKEQKEDEQEI